MSRLNVYVPADRRRALMNGESLPAKTKGAALFADISGFTPLTEALANELGRKRGAEELTQHLNKVYGALVEEVHQYGGSVIVFAGDAITCWFDGDDGLWAISCALAMQARMAAFAAVETPGGEPVALAIKTAVATGPVSRFVVGDPDIQLIDVLAGQTLVDVAHAEHMAERGDVIVGPAVGTAVRERLTVSETRTDEHGEPFIVVKAIHPPLKETPLTVPPALDKEVIRPWVLPPVYDRETYLSELRPAVPFFLSFSGLDYDGDETAGEKLDAFVRWVQRTLAEHDGYMLQVIIGDKGSYLYGAFGAPVAHDDDEARAVAALAELVDIPDELAFIRRVKGGISRGRVWAGAYGSPVRGTYGILGDEVNTAARLMQKAEAGQVLVNQTVAEAADRYFVFNELPPMILKGKAEPLSVAEIVGARARDVQWLGALYAHPLVGREDILARMQTVLGRVRDGRGQILRVEGAAGLGKSHLISVFGRRAQESGIQVVMGAAQSTSRSTPYFAWRQILLSLFGVEGEQPLTQMSQVHQTVTKMEPEWMLRLPLLKDVLGLPFMDNETTAAFDPQLRQEALFSLVTEMIQRWAAERPLVVVLEDVHWMDEASQELTTAVARAIGRDQVLVVVVQRPPVDQNRPYLTALDALSYRHEIDLMELSDEAIGSLAAHRLDGPISPALLTFMQAKAQGNPFFAEELLDALRESDRLAWGGGDRWGLVPDALEALRSGGCLVREEGEWVVPMDAPLTAVDLGVPDSIHGIVLSRIDRLTEAQKLTVKVASVIGRLFSLNVLLDVHPQGKKMDIIGTQLEQIAGRDFVRLESPGAEPVYLFKHNTTQEVAYETLLYAQRRTLHRRVADWYETQFADEKLTDRPFESALAPHFPLLVHHWHHAEDVEKEAQYAALAGEQAANQYVNEDAVRHLRRALSLMDAGEGPQRRFDLLLTLEQVLDRLGERDEQRAVLDEMLSLAEGMEDARPLAQTHLREAEYYQLLGEHDLAIAQAKQVIEFANEGDSTKEIKQAAAVVWGKVLVKTSQYEEAKPRLLSVVENADALLYLGHLAHYQNNHVEAREYYKQALDAYGDLKKLKGVAGGYNMLGTLSSDIGLYIEARNYYERALDVSRSIGYLRGQMILLGNLGNVFVVLGMFSKARELQEQSLQICLQIGDQWGTAITYDTLAVINTMEEVKLREALELARKAEAIQEEIQDKHGLGYTLSHMADTYVILEEWHEAFDIYVKALKMRENIGMNAQAIDNIVGLMWASVQTEDQGAAYEYYERAKSWIIENDIELLENPLLAIWRLANYAESVGNYRDMHGFMSKSMAILNKQADLISDTNIRQRFLKIPLHNRLIRKCQSLGLS